MVASRTIRPQHTISRAEAISALVEATHKVRSKDIPTTFGQFVAIFAHLAARPADHFPARL